MSNLLLVYERDMPTVSGLLDVFSHLALKYDFLNVASASVVDLKPEELDCSDIVLFIRPDNVMSADISEMAHKTGHTVISFFDDDLLSYRPEPPWRVNAMLDTLSNSDIIMSSSRRICEKYKDLTHGKRVSVLDTIVRADQIIKRDGRKDKDTVRFVYAANPGHVYFFDQLVRPVFGEFAERFGGKVSFTFVGVRPDLSEYEDRMDIRYVKGMPLQEYRNFMASGHFDVGIAPLEDTEFTHCKYFNKYIEYSMVGVMGIYSKIVPYIYAVKDHDNGLLAENTREGWLAALSEVASDPQLTDRIVTSAQEDLRTDFNEKRIFERICSDIPELKNTTEMNGNCSSLSASKIRYRFLRVLDLVYLGVYYINNGEFFQKLKTHFRERDAYKRLTIKSQA